MPDSVSKEEEEEETEEDDHEDIELLVKEMAALKVHYITITIGHYILQVQMETVFILKCTFKVSFFSFSVM